MTDIQKMIDEEANAYKTKVHQERVVLAKSYIDSVDIALAVKHGAKFVLSKWQEAERWRKVGEELPEVKREPYHIIARSKLGYQIITICNYGAGVSDQMEYFGVTEWKPIS